jgi:hypothetical protein
MTRPTAMAQRWMEVRERVRVLGMGWVGLMTAIFACKIEIYMYFSCEIKLSLFFKGIS